MYPEIIGTKVYNTLMNRHVPADGYDSNEAQDRTPSWLYRAHELHKFLGVWRWRGMQQHRMWLLKQVLSNKRIIDFGGALGPLGFDSRIVDLFPVDLVGQPVNYSRLSDVNFPVDVVFSSHTIEHLQDLDEFFSECKRVLVSNGILVLFVPAWTCVRWRVGERETLPGGPHLWTFGIEESAPIDTLKNYISLRKLIGEKYNTYHLEYCGDNSIFFAGAIR